MSDREIDNAYSRGYAAGRRRKVKDITAEQRRARENALWQRYMVSALAAAVSAQGWQDGNKKPITNVVARTQLAADFADEAMKRTLLRGRV